MAAVVDHGPGPHAGPGEVVIQVEAAPYGDAMLAAVGVGAATAGDLARWVPAADRQRRVEPHADRPRRDDDVYPQYVGLYADLRERFPAMAQRSRSRIEITVWRVSSARCVCPRKREST